MRLCHLLLGLAVAGAPVLGGLGGGFPISSALGCSGGTGGDTEPGWHALSPQFQYPNDDSANTAIVDGAILFNAGYVDLTDAAVVDSLRVTVTDPGGAEVPGSVEVVAAPPPDPHTYRLLVWRPSAPLPAASGYLLSYEIPALPDPNGYTSGSQRFDVPPTPLSDPAPSPIDATMLVTSELSGPEVFCSAGTGCSSTFGSDETFHPTVRVQTPTRPPTVSDAFLYRLEADPPDAAPPLEFLDDDEPGRDVIFVGEQAEYCVQLSALDLRDGTRLELGRLCPPHDEGAPVESALDANLAACNQPPSDALRDAWCAVHSASVQCASAGDAGALPTRDAGDDTDPGGDVRGNGASSNGGGCTVASAPGQAGGLGVLLVACALGLVRRSTRRT